MTTHLSNIFHKEFANHSKRQHNTNQVSHLAKTSYIIIKYQEQQVKSNLGNGQRWAPLFFQNVETDTSVAVDVWMEYLSPKCNLQY